VPDEPAPSPVPPPLPAAAPAPAQSQPAASVPPPNPPLVAAPHLANLLERGASVTPRPGRPAVPPSNPLANRIDLGDPPRGQTLTGEGQPPSEDK
jgi:hypothetical protein